MLQLNIIIILIKNVFFLSNMMFKVVIKLTHSIFCIFVRFEERRRTQTLFPYVLEIKRNFQSPLQKQQQVLFYRKDRNFNFLYHKKMEGIVICDSTLHSVYSKLNQTLKGRLEAASNFMPASNFVFAFALLSLWFLAGKYPKVWSPQSRKSKLVLFPICLVFKFFSYVY